jgi:hypothetical protein
MCGEIFNAQEIPRHRLGAEAVGRVGFSPLTRISRMIRDFEALAISMLRDRARTRMADPASEADKCALRLNFDRRLTLQFQWRDDPLRCRVAALRELDDAVGLTDTAGEVLADARTGKNFRHLPGGLLRQSVFGRLAGYEDANDADRLCHDPAMRRTVGDPAITESAAAGHAGRGDAGLKLSGIRGMPVQMRAS